MDHKEVRVHFKSVMSVIRKLLKARRITYKILARELHLSESTIKKLFIGGDVSLNRLLKICKILGVPLSDILTACGDREIEQVELSEKAQAYFAKNMDCFRFYWLLAIARFDVEKIKKDNGLSATETRRYLKKLDELGLIELHPQNRIKFTHPEEFLWVNSGPFIRQMKQRWAKALVDEVLQKEISDESGYALRIIKLKPESAKAFQKQLSQLMDDFSKHSAREMMLDRKKVIDVRAFFAFAHGTVINTVSG